VEENTLLQPVAEVCHTSTQESNPIAPAVQITIEPANENPSSDSEMRREAFRELQPLFVKYRQANKNILNAKEKRLTAVAELRAALIKWRDQFTAQGSRTGGGFEAVLKQLGIPKTTAYRHLNLVPSGTKSLTASKPAKRRPKAASAILENIEATASDKRRLAELFIEATEQVGSDIESLCAVEQNALALDRLQFEKAMHALSEARKMLTTIENRVRALRATDTVEGAA